MPHQHALVILMMDSRHPLKDYDIQMLEWANHIEIPVHVLLTKVDKLNRKEQAISLERVDAALKEFSLEFSVQLFSSLKRWGVDEAHEKLDQWFEL